MSQTVAEKLSFYNLGLEGFYKDPLTFYFRLARYKFVWRALQPGDRVLDLAAGDGLGSHILARKASMVLGLDRDPDFVEYARQRLGAPNLEFRAADALRDDLGQGWDVVCLIGLLEYLDDGQSATVLAKVAGALKPGGLAFVGTPNRNSLCVATPRRQETHKRELDPEGLRALCAVNFSRVELYGQNDEFILPSIPEMSFFLMARCQK